MSHTELSPFYEENLPRYLEQLRQMVAINSFTENPDGINKLSDLTAKFFYELGFESQVVPSHNPNFGAHLVMTRSGTGASTVGLVSHLDTVFPEEEEKANEFFWRPTGDKIYGPGTVDIKGGTMLIFMLLEAIKTFAPDIFVATNWKILLNSSEETMAEDFGDLCKKHLDGALACLVFEGGLYQDGKFKLVEARKGRASYEINVSGKASHAGVAHEVGANAIVQLSKTIEQVAALTDYENDLTFNIGYISGGTVTNRVPHSADALGEMRAFDVDIFEQGMLDLMALSGPGDVANKDGIQAQVLVDIVGRTQSWPINEGTDGLIKIWEAAADDLGFQIVRESRGGLSDGNQTWHFVPTLDGLGPGGGNAHASEMSADGSKEQEYILVSSIIPKAILNYVAVMKLLG
jgi:glutamate carboxypeptidase